MSGNRTSIGYLDHIVADSEFVYEGFKHSVAFCYSMKCAKPKNDRSDSGYRVRKPNAHIHDIYCKDCQSALFWQKDEVKPYKLPETRSYKQKGETK